MMKNLIVVSIVAMSLSACLGGGGKNETSVTTTTTGQELTDLQKALEEGVITQAEFDKKKKEILKD